MISKLNTQLTIRILTLPTRIGSGPENSSNTNIWFQTHPLLARFRILCPSLGLFRRITVDAVCKLCVWLFNGAMEEYGTQVIHTNKREVHRSRCISSLRFRIFCYNFWVFISFAFPPSLRGGPADSQLNAYSFVLSIPHLGFMLWREFRDALWCISRTERKETHSQMQHPLVGSSV